MMQRPRITAALLALSLAACGVVDSGISTVTEPAGFALGHYWNCSFDIQYGDPTIVSVETQTFRPCLAPGTAARDAYINAWVIDTCKPAIDAANAAGLAPGGGFCGGDGCDPQNFDICTYDAN